MRTPPTLLAPAAIALLLLAAAPAAPASPPDVAVPRTLDGAAATYAFEWTRAPVLDAAATEGSGTLEVSVQGAAPVQDASGATQSARAWTFRAEGFADLAGHAWEDFHGVASYALDPATGRVVRSDVDGELDWTSVHTPRLRYRATAHAGGLIDPTDSLGALARLLDGLGGAYAQGGRVMGGPGIADYAEAGALQELPPDGAVGRGGRPVPGATAMPLDLLARPAPGLELSGRAWLQPGEEMPARLELRFASVEHGLVLATLRMDREASRHGAPLPDAPAFVPPASHPDAQTAPPLATGTRPSSWAPTPTIEEVLALARRTDVLAQYEAQYPGTYPAVVIDEDSWRYAARLGLVSRDAARLADRLYAGQPSWTIAWYSDADPGLRVVTAVYPDRATGEFVAAASVQGGRLDLRHPDATLTTTSVADLLERASPRLADDATSSATLLYVASLNLWILVRGAGLDAEALVEDPRRLVDALAPDMGMLCAAAPPASGATAAVDGATGLVLGTIEATYLAPRVAAPERSARCAGSLAALAVGGNPFDPETPGDLLAEADGAAQALASYADAPQRPHAPILIQSDADFDLPASVSGVVGGSGTRDDPYVIAGWNVAGAPETPAVTIRGTARHVVVRDNVLHGGPAGVWLDRASHARVEDNRILGAFVGVALLGTTDARVLRNVATHVGVGVHVQSHLLADAEALTLTATPVRGLLVAGNRVDRAEVGMTLFGTYGDLDGVRVEDNVFARSRAGLAADEPTDATLARNAYNANAVGAWLRGKGDGVRLVDETWAGSAVAGLRLDGVRGVEVERGAALDSAGTGILLVGGAQARLSGATLDGNARGIAALRGADALAEGAVFAGPSQVGAYADGARLDAPRSWWGDASGPGGCAPGAGARVTCGVLHAEPLAARPA